MKLNLSITLLHTSLSCRIFIFLKLIISLHNWWYAIFNYGTGGIETKPIVIRKWWFSHSIFIKSVLYKKALLIPPTKTPLWIRWGLKISSASLQILLCSVCYQRQDAPLHLCLKKNGFTFKEFFKQKDCEHPCDPNIGMCSI